MRENPYHVCSLCHAFDFYAARFVVKNWVLPACEINLGLCSNEPTASAEWSSERMNRMLGAASDRLNSGFFVIVADVLLVHLLSELSAEYSFVNFLGFPLVDDARSGVVWSMALLSL